MTFRLPWQVQLAAPARCPACGCDVGVPMLRAYRQAGSVREAAGTVTECAACGSRYTVLREGGVLRFGGQRVAEARAASAAGAAPGGHGTSGPGGLDPDMVTFDTPASLF